LDRLPPPGRSPDRVSPPPPSSGPDAFFFSPSELFLGLPYLLFCLAVLHGAFKSLPGGRWFLPPLWVALILRFFLLPLFFPLSPLFISRVSLLRNFPLEVGFGISFGFFYVGTEGPLGWFIFSPRSCFPFLPLFPPDAAVHCCSSFEIGYLLFPNVRTGHWRFFGKIVVRVP